MESAETAREASSSKSPPSDNAPEKEKEKGNADDDQATKKPSVRKRTKTGCLTCRKRRIKCDEARPICANCIKSKRQCEGYNQRVIFKDPLGAFAPYGPVVYPQPSSQALVREQQLSAAQQKSTSQPLQIIAPKPPPPLRYMPGPVSQFSPPFAGHGVPITSPPLDLDPNFHGTHHTPPSSSKFKFFPPETVEGFSQNQWRQEQQPPEVQHEFSHYQPNVSANNVDQPVPSVAPQPAQAFEVDKGKDHAVPQPVQAPDTQLAEWEIPESDEEMGESDDDEMFAGNREPELGLIVSERLQDRYNPFGIQPRTFGYHPDHTLAVYEPGPGNSPLNNKQIASVFWHFVNVTGPSISLYERHPFDGVSYYHGPQIKSRQHIWTYTFPILALSHPALLQAILAIGSLQIARLEQVPPTASLKHYHLALRRIARNVGLPSKKTQPSNLAATLLLGYYEVWNSDHEKWCKHLLGARWIIRDIPFSSMTRDMMAIKLRLRRKKDQAALEQQQQQAAFQGLSYDPFSTFGGYGGLDQQTDPLQGEQDFLHSDWDCIDVPLLRTLTGKQITYDQFGLIPEEMSAYPRPRKDVSEKDKDTYEVLSDLYWWYCKMDVYQSVLGGTKLFMPYDLWTQCPPRAPMGRNDAIYGTYDHLILVLARLANFASRDLTRKRRVFRARGTFGPSGAPPGTFPGMMPASDRVTLPRGFTPPRDDGSSPRSDTAEDEDLDELTAAAYREWGDLQIALEAFKANLGPDFEPLDQDLHPISMTPFGPAMRYRTYSIAGIWMNYLMGMVALHRAHPEMPPVAMMAAGMSAQHTMKYAMDMARIAHGLEENAAMIQEVSTLVSAAFIESAFCLFVAGVQFQAADQREWLIHHLHHISRLTGWASARQIAEGCETAWTRAAAAGRGPPYTRLSERDPSSRPPKSVWYNPRRLDKRIEEIEDDSARLVLAKEEMPHYALGLIGVEEVLERLDLETADPDGQ